MENVTRSKRTDRKQQKSKSFRGTLSKMMTDELAEYKVDVSHQELSRIIRELEDFCDTCPSETWIAVEAAANWLCTQLGYEDYGELEDALHSTLEEFLIQLPHFDVRKPEPGADDQTTRFRSNLKEHAPGRPCKIEFKVNSRADLWVVMLKPKHSWVEIPEIEFEIGRNENRQVDTIYSYIGEAIYNLGVYLKNNQDHISNERFDGIYATIQMLNLLLDVEHPFTWIIHDPTGTASFKPHKEESLKIELTE